MCDWNGTKIEYRKYGILERKSSYVKPAIKGKNSTQRQVSKEAPKVSVSCMLYTICWAFVGGSERPLATQNLNWDRLFNSTQGAMSSNNIKKNVKVSRADQTGTKAFKIGKGPPWVRPLPPVPGVVPTPLFLPHPEILGWLRYWFVVRFLVGLEHKVMWKK